jgi:hypothetical protein
MIPAIAKSIETALLSPCQLANRRQGDDNGRSDSVLVAPEAGLN